MVDGRESGQAVIHRLSPLAQQPPPPRSEGGGGRASERASERAMGRAQTRRKASKTGSDEAKAGHECPRVALACASTLSKPGHSWAVCSRGRPRKPRPPASSCLRARQPARSLSQTADSQPTRLPTRRAQLTPPAPASNKAQRLSSPFLVSSLLRRRPPARASRKRPAPSLSSHPLPLTCPVQGVTTPVETQVMVRRLYLSFCPGEARGFDPPLRAR